MPTCKMPAPRPGRLQYQVVDGHIVRCCDQTLGTQRKLLPAARSRLEKQHISAMANASLPKPSLY